MNEKKSLILMVEDEEQVLNTNCRIFLSWTLCFRTETVWISAAASAKKP